MPHRPDRVNEHGFVLIGVVWLLLLATSLVAVIMIRARSEAVAVAAEGKALQTELDREAAVHTIAADLLINGPRSLWFELPARGTIQIGPRRIDADLSSEDGRLDLNVASPELIDAALRGAGVAEEARGEFRSRLAELRGQNGRLGETDKDALIATLKGGSSGACLGSWFTTSSGRSDPVAALMPSGLAQALGQAAQAGGQAEIGRVLRIRIGGSGIGHETLFRLSPMDPTPAALLSHGWVRGC